MHPEPHWVKPEDKDSIAQAHVRVNNAMAKAIEEDPSDQASVVAALHNRQLWLETYINNGALDEQISNRVRYEAIHFWNASDEVVLKLKALAELSAKVDVKLKAIDAAIEAFEFQQKVMNDAIPEHYKFHMQKLSFAIKKALAA